MGGSKRSRAARPTPRELALAGGPAESPDSAVYLDESGPLVVFREPYRAPSGRLVDLNGPNPLAGGR
jgi:hypothetical protein